MADEFLSGAGLYAAEPFRVINPTGVSSSQSVQTIQRASENRQQIAAQQQMQQQQIAAQQQANRESMAFQERIERESRAHTESMALKAQKARIGEQVLNARIQQIYADPQLDATKELEQIAEGRDRELAPINENLMVSGLVTGLMKGTLGPEGVMRVVESAADISKGHDESAAAAALHALEALKETTPIDYSQSLAGKGYDVGVGLGRWVSPVIGAVKIGMDLVGRRAPDEGTVGADLRMNGREIDPNGEMVAMGDEHLASMWAPLGARTLEEARAMQQEFERVKIENMQPGAKDRKTSLEGLKEKAAARVRENPDVVVNWGKAAQKLAMVVGDTVKEKKPSTHNEVASLIEGMLSKANQMIDVADKGEQIRFADGIKRDYKTLSEMGVNMAILDLALSRMAEVESQGSVSGSTIAEAGERQKLDEHGMSGATTGGTKSRLARVLGSFQWMPGDDGHLFKNWGGAQTKMNVNRMNEVVRKTMMELQGMGPDDQRRLMRALVDDDPTNDPEIVRNWEGWDPAWKQAFLKTIHTQWAPIEAELKNRNFGDKPISASYWEAERARITKESADKSSKIKDRSREAGRSAPDKLKKAAKDYEDEYLNQDDVELGD